MKSGQLRRKNTKEDIEDWKMDPRWRQYTVAQINQILA